MKGLQKHIEDLGRLLELKGYDGYFLSAGGFPGKLKESLSAFSTSFFSGGEYGITFPPVLTTYCHWKDERSGSVECRFTLDYQETKGFRIDAVALESYDRYGFSEKKKTITVNDLADIPTASQGKCWGAELKKNGSRKFKGLKI